MTIDLIAQVSIAATDTPDTGTLRGDVLAFLTAVDAALRHPLVSRILPDLFAAGVHHPNIAASLRDRVGGARREKAVNVLRRAVERGELAPGTDVELGLDLLVGPLYWGTPSASSRRPDPPAAARRQGGGRPRGIASAPSHHLGHGRPP
ncbi:TetR-like C-terminal domain-containing protein [Spirillospora sp. CA-128828]|uniref:TetR-like C-terminal domain-containing protein n=1 Tax=Spirillospora sp. CA-128828 TaxID=3240033 RepID=UPI003D90B0AE